MFGLGPGNVLYGLVIVYVVSLRRQLKHANLTPPPVPDGHNLPSPPRNDQSGPTADDRYAISHPHYSYKRWPRITSFHLSSTLDPLEANLNRTIGEEVLSANGPSWGDEPIQSSDDSCVLFQSWQAMNHPTCNRMHELDIAKKRIMVVGEGGWRVGWRHAHDDDAPHHDAVIKTLKWSKNFDPKTFEMHRVDAAISERLTSHRHVIDVYGFCGMSSINEFAESTIATDPYLSSYSTHEKVLLGRNMASCLADLHEADGPDNVTIIHNNISPEMFVSADGIMKVSDFNGAHFGMWNTTGHRPCYFGTNKRYSPYCSKEQLHGHKEITEKADVYGLGMSIYFVLTGEIPYGQQRTDRTIRGKVREGILPDIAMEFRNSTDYYTRLLVDAIQLSARKLPADRPTARELYMALNGCQITPTFTAEETQEATEKYFVNTTRDECIEQDTSNWRILISGNIAYENDLLNWWSHCKSAALFDERTEVILYAEDQAMYDKYVNSTKMTVKKSWLVGTKYNDAVLTGKHRFTWTEKEGFGHLVSRRASIFAKELRLAKENNEMLLFMDLDTMVLKDPRPYFCGKYDLWGADAQVGTGPFNTGLLALRPTSRMMETIQLWRKELESREKAGTNQKSFNRAVRRMERETGLRSRILPPPLFPVGRDVFSMQCFSPKVIGAETVVFHNNWCSAQKKCKKSKRARKLGLWNPVLPIEIM